MTRRVVPYGDSGPSLEHTALGLRDGFPFFAFGAPAVDGARPLQARPGSAPQHAAGGGSFAQAAPLLETKLRLPPITPDLVRRPHLIARLNAAFELSLTMVSAPAGYGKTTLLASWLEQSELPHAWLSLDEGVGDFGAFAAYFVAAIRTVFPQACPKSTAALVAEQLPSAPLLASLLCAELEMLPERMVLVLDDIQHAGGPQALELLSLLLRYPLARLHLVLLGRHDPFLPLARLRARGQLAEVRSSDLRFSREEAGELLQKTVLPDLPSAVLETLVAQTEGWAVGLRLAALSIATLQDAQAMQHKLRRDSRYVLDYLAEEVLAELAPAAQELLLLASLPDRFCASLLDAMMAAHADRLRAAPFIAWLERENLFVTAADGDGEWRRFHPLFRQLLRRLARSSFSPRQLAGYHLRISAWLAGGGLLAEAVDHCVEAGDELAAVQLVEEHLSSVLNREDKTTLERWRQRLPDHLFSRHPALAVVKALSLYLHGNTGAILPHVLKAEELLAAEEPARPERSRSSLLAAVSFLKSQQAYWRGDFALSLELAQRALIQAPLEDRYVRGSAMLYSALAMQRMGEGAQAVQDMLEALVAVSDWGDIYAQRVRLALGLLYAYSGEWVQITQIVEGIVEPAAASGSCSSLSLAHCLLGRAAYERNRMDDAMAHFAAATRQRSRANARITRAALLEQAAIHMRRGEFDDADELAGAAREMADESNSVDGVFDARAFYARLTLAQGAGGSAGHYLPVVDPAADVRKVWSTCPTSIRVEVLLAKGGETELLSALSLTESYVRAAETAHSEWRLIDGLVLQATVLQALDRPKAALQPLRRALALAQPRDAKRIFLDHGERLANLLHAARGGACSTFVDELLAEGRRSPAEPTAEQKVESYLREPELIESLTFRELDVLQLLAERYSNKEIAEKLVISTGTVRSHTANIYQKLQVASRRQAVLKAQALHIL